MAKSIVGLEITEEGVRAAEVMLGRTPRVIAHGSVPLPPGAAKDSEVFDSDAVVLALRQLWSRAGIKGKNVVLGIGSRRILVRDYTTQAMRPDLLAQALPFQVQDLLPVPAEQAVLDFYPVSQEGDQVSGLLVAAVAETVDELVTAVSKAKLTVDVVDLAPFALARAVSGVAAAGETLAALYLGDHTTYVVVVQDGVPRFVRIIPMEIATEAVRTRAAIGDGVEPTPAMEEVFETVPPSDAPTRRRSAQRGAARTISMSEEDIREVVSRLGSTLRFYADRSAEAPVTRVLLSGAGAAVPGVAEALTASLPMPVQVVGLSSILQTKGALASNDVDFSLVSTAGLAMGVVR
jgi:type IV pilus assembly protein PilM